MQILERVTQRQYPNPKRYFAHRTSVDEGLQDYEFDHVAYDDLWEIPFSAVKDYLKNYAREHYFVECY